MSEVVRQEKSPALPTPAGNATRDAARPSGAANSVKNQLRATPGFDAQAALLCPVQRKPDPFAGGASRAPNGKPVGGACKAGDASTKSFAAGVKREAKPGPAKDIGDIADPRTCQEQGLEVANVESVDDRPDDAALFVIANDAATVAVSAMKEAVVQRMSGFRAGAKHLSDSADEINEDKDGLLSFVEKAFSVVTSALMGVGLGAMSEKGAIGVLKGLIEGVLELGIDAVAGLISESTKGGEVDFAAFSKDTEELGARLSLQVDRTWKVADIRTRILNAPYPHREAPGAVAGPAAIRDQAFRMQFTSSVTSWANTVNQVKGGDAGVLILDVAFDQAGGFAVQGCEVPVMGQKFKDLLTKGTNNGEQTAPLTLAEVLNAPTGGMKLIIRDQSQATYIWDPAQHAISTPDAELMHHRVGAWGVANVGPGVVPVVYAHRFLFEALGVRTFSDLGVGR